MKKRSLLRVVGIVIIVYALLTWILQGSYYSGGLQEIGKYQVGLFNLFQIPLESFSYFYNIFIFILVVGGFYGIMNEIEVYQKVKDCLVEKFKGKEKVFLIATIIILAVISSITGLELGLLFIFPFLISVLMLMGYDKLTSIAATFGATIVGMFGSTFAATMYTQTNSALGITKYTDNIWLKLVLFVLGTGLLVAFVLLNVKAKEEKDAKKEKKLADSKKKKVVKEKKAKKKKPSKKDLIFLVVDCIAVLLLLVSLVLVFCGKEIVILNAIALILPTALLVYNQLVKKQQNCLALVVLDLIILLLLFAPTYLAVKLVAIAGLVALFVLNVIKKEKDSTLLVVALNLVVLFLLVGTINWSGVFKIDTLTNSYNWFMSLTIGKDLPIFGKLFGGLATLGTFIDPNRFTYYTIIILVGLIFVAAIYKVKYSDFCKKFLNGMKEYLPAAIIAMIAMSVLVLVSSYPVFLTIGDALLKITKTFNIATTSIYTMLGSVLYVDIYYFPQYVLGHIAGVVNEASLNGLINVIFVSIYSLTMLIAPTGVLLLTTLETNELKYRDWIKYIWKLFLGLLVVALIAFAIVAVL